MAGSGAGGVEEQPSAKNGQEDRHRLAQLVQHLGRSGGAEWRTRRGPIRNVLSQGDDPGTPARDRKRSSRAAWLEATARLAAALDRPRRRAAPKPLAPPGVGRGGQEQGGHVVTGSRMSATSSSTPACSAARADHGLGHVDRGVEGHGEQQRHHDDSPVPSRRQLADNGVQVGARPDRGTRGERDGRAHRAPPSAVRSPRCPGRAGCRRPTQ